MKKAFEAKSETDRTQNDVDFFTTGVKEINIANDNLNNIKKKASEGRHNSSNKWNKAGKVFADDHIPYYK